LKNIYKDARKMVEDENYEDLEKWMKKANTLHEIL
jgi:prephenate dehydrogenase